MDEGPEPQLVVVADLMDCGDHGAECLESVFGKAMVAKGNVQVHIAGGSALALGARADGPELGGSAIEAQCPSHQIASTRTE
jgi:hypothetical protein